jgi:hypothetical protein
MESSAIAQSKSDPAKEPQQQIHCKYQLSFANGATLHGPLSCSVQVGNLQSETDQDQFDTITGLPSPSYFTLGPPSHSYPESRSEFVFKYLSEQGMESWTVIPTDGTYRGKAAAKFESRETASRAIAALNNTEVKELGRSKLFLAHQYSVKFSTPTDILTAVKEQIETLEQNLRESGHVRLKCYPHPTAHPDTHLYA